MSFNWVCPHCNRAQSVVDEKFNTSVSHVRIEDLAEGMVALCGKAVGCANPECRRLTLDVSVQSASYDDKYNRNVDWGQAPLLVQRLLPESHAKPQPEYVPDAIREDYREACRIRDLSPKASATLARRCLQGMIRDFAKIADRTLDKEIRALRAAVDEGRAPRGVTEESVDAIDQVRKVGNIGAHMERDIDFIIPVDPGEAQILIELIEMLFDEWYVSRHNREQKLQKLALVAAEKQLLIEEARNTGSDPDGS